LGSGKLGVRLAAHSQLILLRVRLVLRPAAGWRQPPAAASPLKVFKNYGRPLAATKIKNSGPRHTEPLANKALEQAKFCPHQNFAKRKPIFQGAERHKRHKLIDIFSKSVKITNNNGVYKVVIS